MSEKKLNIVECLNDLPDTAQLHGSLAIDTEAMGLKIKRDRLCLLQICDEKNNVFLVHFPAENVDYKAPNLKKYLTDKGIKKIFHFARFDIAIMQHYLKIKTIPNIFCTKIASRLTRTYTDSHGLKNLVHDLLGVEMRKDQQCSNWGNDTLTEKQKCYAARDVIYLHALEEKLSHMLHLADRQHLAQKYFEFINTVCASDLAGFEEDLFRHI